MAKIMNFQMKNIKRLTGREGYGCTASLYLDGKRIGTYADYADGGPEDVEYISKEAEEAMMKTIIAYAKKVPNKFVINLYQKRPEQYKKECEWFRKTHPYIPEEDITKETMASNSIVYIVSGFLKLYDAERQFKKFSKKGYIAISVEGNQIFAYPPNYSKEQIMAEADGRNVYFSLDDFNIMQEV